MKYQQVSGYAEWEGYDLSGETFQDFLNRGSKKFKLIEKLIAPVNREPGERNAAKAAVFDLLSARTPFSSIMPFEAMALLKREGVSESVSCIQEYLQQMDCNNDIFNMSLECTGNNPELALSILGILSTQRMYFIRDWKSWMEQKMQEEDFRIFFSIFKKSSQIYFQMETYACQCASNNLYPEGITGNSYKAYHFWSTAILAYKLAGLGIDQDTAVKESIRPARKYKLFIQLPGMAYNMMLGNSLFAGTAGDYKKIIVEQKKGANWGFALYHLTLKKQ